METVAVNFHDDTGNSVGKIELTAGDDAVGVQWKEVSGDMVLYASHKKFLEEAAKLHAAHWWTQSLKVLLITLNCRILACWMHKNSPAFRHIVALIASHQN